MVLRSIIVLLGIHCIVACTDEVEPRPDYILKEQHFVEVLVDFALAESAASINIKNERSDRIDSVYAFDPLSQHGIEQSQYDSTIAWYARNPSSYKTVYQKVLAKLSELQSVRPGTTMDSAAVSQTAPASP